MVYGSFPDSQAHKTACGDFSGKKKARVLFEDTEAESSFQERKESDRLAGGVGW